MDKIQEYESDSSASSSSSEERKDLDARRVRKVYLITYSQAKIEQFPTRESFANAVLRSFENTPAKVIQWSCCMENHKEAGVHFHMAIKLDRNQRWISSKRRLQEQYGISVHFSNVHCNYYSAWKYVAKSDIAFIESAGHPDLRNCNSPRTTQASSALIAKAKRKDDETRNHSRSKRTNIIESEDECEEKTEEENKKKKRRLTSYELSRIIVEKGVKNRLELLALAHSQELEGKTDVAEFIVNRGTKAVNEVIDTAWDLQNAKEKLCRSQKTRMELLIEAKDSTCVEGCNGQWLECAKEVLERNGILLSCFAEAVQHLLEKGRGKYRNLMIVGPTNCAKTFILMPLTLIYATFCNPASTSFAWVGAQEAECLFLNDFRWSANVIPWHDFLLMLEGQLVHLPAPKTYYSKDLVFDRDTPIFCTGKNQLIYVKGGVVDQRETDMMAVRWKTFHFHHQIREEEHKELLPCPKCFAELIL